MPEAHDVNCSLMPPVKHQDHQNVPHLVAGTQIVQLARKITLRDLGDVEQKGRSSDQIHHNHTGQEQLYNISGQSTIQPNPVTRRNYTDASHTAEDCHPYSSPVVAEVTGVDLGAEDGQDQG